MFRWISFAVSAGALLWRGGSWYMGHDSWLDVTLLTQALVLLASVGYLGIMGGSTLAMIAYAVVRRQTPPIVWWLLATLLVCWLYYLYVPPFTQARRDLELTRAKLEKDWNKDCFKNHHASLEFHTNCINTERVLAQDDILVASGVASAAVYDRLLTVGSWALLLAAGALLVFGAMMHYFLRREQGDYVARKTKQ